MVVRVLQVAIPFVWLGMVLAISFLEAPLKFHAPGITVPLGLGIGRLVFRALNAVEVVLGVLLAVAVLAGPAAARATGIIAMLVALGVVLLIQLAVLRPPLNRRTRAVLRGEDAPGSRVHLVYIALEVIKVVLLIVLGWWLASLPLAAVSG